MMQNALSRPDETGSNACASYTSFGENTCQQVEAARTNGKSLKFAVGQILDDVIKFQWLWCINFSLTNWNALFFSCRAVRYFS